MINFQEAFSLRFYYCAPFRQQINLQFLRGQKSALIAWDIFFWNNSFHFFLSEKIVIQSLLQIATSNAVINEKIDCPLASSITDF